MPTCLFWPREVYFVGLDVAHPDQGWSAKKTSKVGLAVLPLDHVRKLKIELQFGSRCATPGPKKRALSYSHGWPSLQMTKLALLRLNSISKSNFLASLRLGCLRVRVATPDFDFYPRVRHAGWVITTWTLFTSPRSYLSLTHTSWWGHHQFLDDSP